MAKAKSVARGYVRWPSLDAQIEEMTCSCVSCQTKRSAPAVEPLHPWTWPTKLWRRINIDFAGPIEGRTLLIVVDAHSHWPEVLEMRLTAATAMIQGLHRLFALYKFPVQLVSDNGPEVTSTEFQEFSKANGIKNIRCAPYHPSSNGAAERFVQMLKTAMKVTEKSSLSFQ